jgi:hypothetical protein
MILFHIRSTKQDKRYQNVMFFGYVLDKIGFPMNGNKIKFRFGECAFKDPLLCGTTDFCVT